MSVSVENTCIWNESGAGRSGTIGGRSPGSFFGFYLKEASQSQTDMEEIVYNKSR